jgi:hypothetical protein
MEAGGFSKPKKRPRKLLPHPPRPTSPKRKDTPADAQPEAEAANVAADNADTAEVESEVDGE